MPNVLSKKEFNEILQVVKPTTLTVVKNYLRQVELGRKLDVNKLNKIRMICYIRNLLAQTWEQGNFTNEEYSNYMTDADVRNLYAKLLKLSKNV